MPKRDCRHCPSQNRPPPGDLQALSRSLSLTLSCPSSDCDLRDVSPYFLASGFRGTVLFFSSAAPGSCTAGCRLQAAHCTLHALGSSPTQCARKRAPVFAFARQPLPQLHLHQPNAKPEPGKLTARNPRVRARGRAVPTRAVGEGCAAREPGGARVAGAIPVLLQERRRGYSPVQYSPVHSSPVQYSPVQSSPVQSSTVQSRTPQAGSGLAELGLGWTGLDCAALARPGLCSGVPCAKSSPPPPHAGWINPVLCSTVLYVWSTDLYVVNEDGGEGMQQSDVVEHQMDKSGSREYVVGSMRSPTRIIVHRIRTR
jgi:hypothetical protein